MDRKAVVLFQLPQHIGRDLGNACLWVGGVSHIRGVKKENGSALLDAGHGLAAARDSIRKKSFEAGKIDIRTDFHLGFLGIAKNFPLQGGIDDIGVIAVAHDGFADGDGFSYRLGHQSLLEWSCTEKNVRRNSK